MAGAYPRLSGSQEVEEKRQGGSEAGTTRGHYRDPLTQGSALKGQNPGHMGATPTGGDIAGMACAGRRPVCTETG